MKATIEKNIHTKKYEVIKWSDDFKEIETFITSKKNIAEEKFIEFFRETYKS
jgi:hypothetical protein